MKIKPLEIRLFISFFFLQVFVLKSVNAQQPLTLSSPTTGDYSSNVSIRLAPGFSTSGPFHAYIIAVAAPDPNQDQNYIRTKTYRIASTTVLPDPEVSQVNQVVQYFDGLGRPSQTVQIKGSPNGNDIVQPIAYDAFGRETVKYLPYAEQSGNGSYRPSAISTQAQFYGNSGWDANVAKTSAPYSQTVFEPSPLNRVLEQGAPGTIWQPAGQRTSASGRTATISYAANNVSTAYGTSGYAVRLWSAVPVAGSNAMSLSNSGYYTAGQLFLKITTDENWSSADGKAGTTEEYTDKEEHIVLKRTFNKSDNGMEVLSTYYVYDDLGRLSFVLPPASGGDSDNIDQTALDNLCYQYRYDSRSRQNEKKLPGKGWEFTAYNTLDQIVFTQDSKQRSKTTQEWTFIKYDALGRAAMTGITVTGTADNNVSSPNRSTFNDIQNFYSTAANSQWEVRDGSSSTGYTSVNNPTGDDHPFLTINYYDDYTFPGNPYTATANGVINNVKGLLTGSKTAVLNPDGTYGQMLWTVHYYDKDDREIQTFQQHYLGGSASYSTNNYDEVTNTYDFPGQLTATVRHHYISTNTAAPALVTSIAYMYDHVGRRLQATEAISTGNNPLPQPHLLSQQSYNEIGQLKNKYLDVGMQSIFYTYNERGWLRTMKSGLFNLDLRYDNPDAGGQPQWNGNISQMNYLTTKVASPGLKSFSYTYDKLNRLVQANSSGSVLDEGVSYDLMGNITSLNRGSAGVLQYTYTGNQLSSVTGYSPRTYQYDVNGNATSDGVGRGISYNILNLPATITQSGSSATLATYTYDAAGNKLRNSGSDGTWDYINGIVYHNNVIEFVSTEEGRIKLNAGVFSYEYNLKDHLGNTRVSFDKYDNAPRIIQEDEYYSFGLRKPVGGYDLANNNRYLYNGKELQTDLSNQYDYGARFYDPVVGRWTTIDPLVEFGQESTSPYGYVFDDPVKNTDPDGREPDEDPPGKLSIAGNFVKGVGQSLWGTVTGTVNTILHPINTIAAIHNLSTPQGTVDLSMSAFGVIDKFNNGNGDVKANMLGQLTGDVAQLFIGSEEVKLVSESFKGVKASNEVGEVVKVSEVYKRPNNATTAEQRASVQNKPCVTCGEITPKQVADHKTPLVQEHYRTGSIDKKKMKDVKSVQPQCPTCSARQGAAMSKYSKEQKKLNGL